MADQKSPEEQPKAKAKKAEDAATLTFIGVPYTGALLIGAEEFDVIDGQVEVPGRLFAAAHQAGFR